MAKTIAELALIISADAKRLNKTMNAAELRVSNFGKAITKAGKNASLYVTGPLALIGANAVKNFDAQAKALAQVEQGLKSTGGAAGRTLDQLKAQAEEFQKRTIFGDEEILQGATAQLLTFTNIAGEQFDRTQAAALDLATRLDGDLKSASIQLGKALNDPVANLSALSRSGIQFSDSQKEVINALVESGRLADAQTIILDELDKQYGGSAEAATAGAGGIKQFANAVGDLQEELGAIIIEYITPLIQKAKEVAASFQELSPEAKRFIVVFGGLAAAVGPVLVVVGKLISSFNVLKVALLGNPIGIVVAAVTAAVAIYAAWSAATNSVTASQRALNEVQSRAAQATAQQKTELELLLKAAKDENAALETRQRAIKKLNDLSPEYLGNLSLETINTDKATTAVNNYIQALDKRAKVQAAQDLLVEINKKLLDQAAIADEATSGWNSFVIGLESIVSPAGAVQREAGLVADAVRDLTDQKAALLDFLNTTEDGLIGAAAGSSEAEDNFTRLAASVNTTAMAFANLSAVQGRGINTDTFTQDVAASAGPGPDQLQTRAESDSPLFNDLVMLQEQMDATAERAQAMGEAFGSVFMEMGSAARDGLQALSRVMAKAIRDLVKMSLMEATAALIPKILASLPFPVNVAVAGAAPGIVSGLFDAAVPAFAAGGMVTGATLAMVGDNPSGKEAIIPFEKMGQFLGQFGSNVNVSVSDILLEGDKLRIVLDRADKLNNNTV